MRTSVPTCGAGKCPPATRRPSASTRAANPSRVALAIAGSESLGGWRVGSGLLRVSLDRQWRHKRRSSLSRAFRPTEVSLGVVWSTRNRVGRESRCRPFSNGACSALRLEAPRVAALVGPSPGRQYPDSGSCGGEAVVVGARFPGPNRQSLRMGRVLGRCLRARPSFQGVGLCRVRTVGGILFALVCSRGYYSATHAHERGSP